MSGPIVRKYGFPNHDKIFGSRPLEHGVDSEQESPEVVAHESTPAKSTTKSAPKSKKSETKKKI